MGTNAFFFFFSFALVWFEMAKGYDSNFQGGEENKHNTFTFLLGKVQTKQALTTETLWK